MNIFEALTQGKGRINEENMSSLLGHILNPSDDHEFGDTFLRLFLRSVAIQCDEPTRFEEILNHYYLADVAFEEIYSNDVFRRMIDITIRLGIGENGVFSEHHRIIIENKIISSSAQENQLKEEFLLVEDSLKQNNSSALITVVFITPTANNHDLRSEYNALNHEILGKHKKAWLLWYDDGLENNITSLLSKMLQEAKLNERTHITINNLIKHIKTAIIPSTSFSIQKTRRRSYKNELIDQIEVNLVSGKYIINQYSSKTITVLDVAKNREVSSAIAILRKIIVELNLVVDTKNSRGNEKNTQQLGKEVMNALRKR